MESTELKRGSAEYIGFCRSNTREYQHPRRDELLKLFQIEHLWALQRRLLFNRNKLKHYEQIKNDLIYTRIKAKKKDKWIPGLFIESIDDKIQRASKSIHYLRKEIRYRRLPKEEQAKEKFVSIDINEIKKIKIIDYLKGKGYNIERGFFKLRNEKTASCHINEKKNLWYDHGSGEGGSIIDLHIKIYGCDIGTAIKELSYYL